MSDMTRSASRCVLTLGASLFVVGACGDGGDDGDNASYGYDTGGMTGTGSGGPVSGGTSSGGSTPVSSGGSIPISTGGSGNVILPVTGGSPGKMPYVEACQGIPVEETAGEEACVDTAFQSEPMPVDLFIMMDRSESMKELVAGATYTRWEGIKAAVAQFVTDPDVLDRRIRMGINFFSHTGGFTPKIDCNIVNYADPGTLGVPMDFVDINGDEILAAIEALQPGGQTPTMPALQGALQYAASFNASQGSGRAQVVVLVTDGLPTQCQDTLSIPEIAGVAETAYMPPPETNLPQIRTFIVGIGPALSNLDQIAAKGGTDKAFHIEQGDAAAQFVDALKNITLSELSCEFEIPKPPNSDELLDLKKVRMMYWPDGAGTPNVEEIPYLESYSGCFGSSSGGWYYDNPEAPTAILVCPCTCTRLRTGYVDVQYGCVPRAV